MIVSEAVVTSFFNEVVKHVREELGSAVEKHGFERTPMNPDRDPRDDLVVLVEEVGEVARALTYDNRDDANLYEELVQTAAMATAMAMGLKMRNQLDRPLVITPTPVANPDRVQVMNLPDCE